MSRRLPGVPLPALAALAILCLGAAPVLQRLPSRRPAATPTPARAVVPSPPHSVAAELEVLIHRAQQDGALVAPDVTPEGSPEALDLARALDLFGRDLAGLDRRAALHLLATTLLCQSGEAAHALFHLEQALSYQPDNPKLIGAGRVALLESCWRAGGVALVPRLEEVTPGDYCVDSAAPIPRSAVAGGDGQAQDLDALTNPDLPPTGAAPHDFPGLMERLRSPRTESFVLSPLSAAESAARRCFPPDEEVIAEQPELRGREIVLLQTAGRRGLAVSLSTELDPARRGSRGGYWAQISTDDARSWSSAMYLGLAENDGRGLRVLSRSRVHPFDGDAIRIEMERRVGGAPATEHVARFNLETLLLDSDGDGLSDLVEERLASDPRSPDTDGDALDDAWDAVPLSPVPAPGDDADAVIAALAIFTGGEILGGAVLRHEGLVSPRAGNDGCDPERRLVRPPSGRDRTWVWPAAKARFGGYRTGARVVFLPSEAAELWLSKFTSSPEPFPEVRLRADGQEASVSWQVEGVGGLEGRSGTARLRRFGNVWRVDSRTLSSH